MMFTPTPDLSPTPQKGLRVGIYNRCSTQEESQVNALELQAKQSREIAKQLGWMVVYQYIESISGTSTKGRIEYQPMLADLQADKFDVLIIKSLDRLMRSNKYQHRIKIE